MVASNTGVSSAAAPQWILWAGTVGFETALTERFAAASALGCRRVTLSPPDVLRAEQAGGSAAAIGRQARDLGLELIVDPVMNWYPDSGESPSRFAHVPTAEALRICAELEAVSFTVIATETTAVPLPELAEHLRAVCDAAAEFGAQVQLEFLPFTVVRNVEIAWDLVRAADRPNAGLVFDTWHFFRGDPDYAALRAVPGERILCVQIDDATAEPSAPMRQETARRLLPGDGGLDLVGVLRVLHEIGGLSWIGPEVISPELAAMPVLASAGLAQEKARAVLDAALGQRAR